MSRPLVLSLWVIALGCGPSAAPAPAPTSDATAGDEEAAQDCDALRRREAEAQAALEACRAATPEPEWPAREAFDWLEQEIGARLDGIRRGEAVSANVIEMQQIAERVWALLDEIPEEQRDPSLLARVEDGAEGLMRQQDAEGREQALAQLAGALGALRERLEPAPPADACEGAAREAAAAWMSAQAACGDAANE